MARITHSRTAAGALLSALVLAFAYACSNYGDGERCDSRGSNLGQDDCKDGLLCTTGAARGDQTAPDLCCPPNRNDSVSAACKSAKQAGSTFTDGGTVVDTGVVVPSSDASSSSDAAEGG